MQIQEESLRYKQTLSKNDMSKIITAIGIPLAIFALGAVCIFNLASLGTYLVGPLSAAMWIMGLITSIALPSHRRQSINMTLGFCAGYYAGLLGLKVLVMIMSGLSSEMMSASLNITIATSAGSTMIGMVSNVLAVLAVIVPITYIATMAKMLYQFRRNKTQQQEFAKASGIRRTGKDSGRRHF